MISFLTAGDGRRFDMIKIKRIIALILTAAMIGSHISIPVVYAKEDETSEYAGFDFSGRELLVGSSDPAVFDGMNVVSSYNGIYLVSFETVEETAAAYAYFSSCADFVDINVEFTVSDSGVVDNYAENTGFEICGEGDGSLGRLGQLVEDEATIVPAGTVAVIDTGINADDLVGRVSMIDDGDGSDDNGHGTRVYEFIKDEYPEAKVLSIKALGSDGKGSAADIYAAIRYAVECKVDIINLSVSAFAAAENELIRDAVDMAFAMGILVVGAAGNYGRDAGYYIPGNIESAVIAGACDNNGLRLSKSNYGATVDYNVVSGSTSEAAARLSGILASCMEAGYDGLSKCGKVFPADYVPEDSAVAEEHGYGDDSGMNGGAGESTGQNDYAGGGAECDPWFTVALTEKPAEGPYIVNEGTGDSYDPPYYHFYRYTADNGNEAICVDNDYNGFDDETFDDEEGLYCYLPMTRTEIYADKQGSEAERTGYYLLYYLLTHKIRLGDEDYTIFSSHYGHLAMCYWNWKYNGAADSNSTLPDSFEYDEDMLKGWIIEALKEENIADCGRYDFHVYRYIYNGPSGLVQSYVSYEIADKPHKLKLKKTAKLTGLSEITENSPNYSLAGAAYEVRKGAENGELVASLTTDSYGNTGEITVMPGTYYVKEKTASPGYKLDSRVYSVVVSPKSEEVITVSSVEEPDYALLDLSILKTDREGARIDGADISGAEFTVSFYKGTAARPYYESADQLVGVNPDRSWKFKTDSNGRISFSNSEAEGSSFYLDGSSRRILPFGTIVIEETKSPRDYSEKGGSYNFRSKSGEAVNISGRKLIVQYTAEGILAASKLLSPGTELTVKNQVLRGDISLQKNDRVTGRGMQGVHFVIKSMASGESVEVVTDENGYWSSASTYALHTKETNSAKAKAGTWVFGTESKAAVEIDNTVGAFPTGIYEVREIVPEGYYSADVEPFTVEVKAGDEGEVINRTITNDRMITVSTRAHDSATLTQAALASENARLIDVVDYSDAVRGQTYTVFTKLVAKESGKVIASGRKSFSAAGGNGSLEIAVDCDLLKLAGKDVVFFEYIYKGNLTEMTGEAIGSHENINDEGQTIHIPEASTTARTGDGLQEAFAGKNAQIIDEFKYKNLPTGIYRVSGRLVFADGTAVKDDNGREVTCEKVFSNSEMNGSTSLTFSFDAETLEGKSVVVFERLYDEEGHLLIIHEDVSDAEQTISFPKVRTLASGRLAGYGETSEKRTNVVTAGEDCSIVDFIVYENLTPGNSYLVKGCLRYMDGQPVVTEDGEPVTAEAEFSPEERNGEAAVVFNFDSSFLAGETVYISEELFINGVLIGKHDDSSDTQQIVYFPQLSTHARDDYSGIKTGEWRDTIEITDVVTYSNIMVGQEFVVRGRLMNRLTGEPYRDKYGEEVIAYSEVFIPEKSSGKIEVKFSFDVDVTGISDGSSEVTPDDEIISGDGVDGSDNSNSVDESVSGENVDGFENSDSVDESVSDASQRGVSLVVFEELLICNGEERGVAARHEDIDDEGQTIYYPRGTKEKIIEKIEEHYEKIIENNTETTIERIIERLTEKETEKVIERLKEGDNYHIYLYYLEMLGILNINLLTDGDTREDFPILAETSEEKTSEAVTEIVQTEKKVEDKQVINDIQPKTGDESPVLLMVVMLIVSAAAMLVFMRIKNRNKAQMKNLETR